MADLAQNNRVRIMLVADHPLVHQGLRLTIGEEQAAGFHEAEDGSTGRLGAQGRLLPGQHRQVIRVELAAPVGMLLVLEGRSLAQWLSEGRMPGTDKLEATVEAR